LLVEHKLRIGEQAVFEIIDANLCCFPCSQLNTR
jgi:hypothetical protein